MRLGLLARADNGGLGNLTLDFADALRPDVVIVVELGEAGRGPTTPARYAPFAGELRLVRYPILDPDPVLDGIDVLYTAEVPYGPTLLARARARGVRVVLHAMPELWLPDYAQAAEVWLPTSWATQRVAEDCAALGTPWRVMPVPVALARFPFRPRTELVRALHVAAPAMLDRNGTELVVDAYRREPEGLPPLAARHVPRGLAERLGWSILAPSPTHYGAYPLDVDLLVLPRRYAGLSLLVQEAAACGIPALMLDRQPEADWPGVLTIPALDGSRAQMAGGRFTVHNADPLRLADELGHLAGNSAPIVGASLAARDWAEDLDWRLWAPRYREALGLLG